ncbi:MAG: hypothetical protein ACK4YQ_09190 [Phenylobacterium sp.]|uniref:hypothetical protein n=1 Tax=Phenylobacterium sp. TaxID=1871053 RepID=UPI00391A1B10
MIKAELKAAEYRVRALHALALAEDATLDRVRELQRHSAATWTQMAEAEEARARDTRRAGPSQGD